MNPGMGKSPRIGTCCDWRWPRRVPAGIKSKRARRRRCWADTAVVLNDNILGKADTVDQARAMLRQLSGRTHQVHSAVALIDARGREHSALNVSNVIFRKLTDGEIDGYCATGEPLGKAGGYAVQGRAAVFIERLEGSYSGVMGLPLFETAQLLKGMPIN